MFFVILVISNASLLTLAAVILRSEFGTLKLCILHSDILFIFVSSICLWFQIQFYPCFLLCSAPFICFFSLYQIALYFISHFRLSLIWMN